MPKKSTCNNRNPNPPCLDGYYEKKNRFPTLSERFLLQFPVLLPLLIVLPIQRTLFIVVNKFFKKENLGSFNFRGKQYPMPGAIEEWLEMRYGNDWRVPKTYKGDWKEECFDMKKIGRVS